MSTVMTDKIRFNIYEKIENLLCFITIVYIFIFNYGTSGEIAMTNALIIMFSSIELCDFIINNKRTINKYIVSFAIFVVLCVISLGYTIAYEGSLIKVKTLTMLLVFMVALCNYTKKRGRLLFFVKTICYASILAALYTIAYSSWRTGQRVATLIGNTNQVGAYFAYSSVLLYWCTYTGKLNKVIGWLGMGLVVFGVLISGSRSALGETILGLGVTNIMLGSTVEQKTHKKLIGFLLISAVLMIVYHLAMTNEILYEIIGIRIESMFQIFNGEKSTINENSILERQIMLREGWKLFLRHPIIGSGIDGFASYAFPVLGKSVFCHNNFLELMCGVGIVGALVYYSFHVMIAVDAFENKSPQTMVVLAIMLQMVVAHIAVVFYYQKLEILFMVLLINLVKNKI